MSIKTIATAIILFFILISFCSAAKKEAISFEDTLVLLRQALLEKDIETLNRHIALRSIIKSKVKKFVFVISPASPLAGAAIKLSEPLITKRIYDITVSEYFITPRAFIKSYLRALKINKIETKGKKAYASATFLGKPAALYASKIKDKWVITGAGSAIVDDEIKMLLKSLW